MLLVPAESRRPSPAFSVTWSLSPLRLLTTCDAAICQVPTDPTPRMAPSTVLDPRLATLSALAGMVSALSATAALGTLASLWRGNNVTNGAPLPLRRKAGSSQTFVRERSATFKPFSKTANWPSATTTEVFVMEAPICVPPTGPAQRLRTMSCGPVTATPLELRVP